MIQMTTLKMSQKVFQEQALDEVSQEVFFEMHQKMMQALFQEHGLDEVWVFLEMIQEILQKVVQVIEEAFDRFAVLDDVVLLDG
ncbi:hypothetical protein MRX96_016049 [Rhipicephalus microplus]